jgi:glucose-6-phosphate 1-dehydrogenase
MHTDNPWDVKYRYGNRVSDAFVFFGATGDLAYKKTFPALYGMVQHGTLRCPVIGVAKSGWGLSHPRRRTRKTH